MHERYPLQLRLTSCGHALPDAAIHVLPEPLHLEHRVVALTAGTHVWSWIHHAMPVPEVQARQSGVDWACAAIANEIAVNDARELHEVFMSNWFVWLGFALGLLIPIPWV